jgi:hypothetical protein
VLDDDHGPTGIDESVEQADEVIDVLQVEPCRRLVEDVDLSVAGHLDRQLEAPALAARDQPFIGQVDAVDPDLHRLLVEEIVELRRGVVADRLVRVEEAGLAEHPRRPAVRGVARDRIASSASDLRSS